MRQSTGAIEIAQRRLLTAREDLARLRADRNPSSAVGSNPASGETGRFPRSRTMKALCSGPGAIGVGAIFLFLIWARPGAAIRLLRRVPLNPVVLGGALRFFANYKAEKSKLF